MSTDPVQADPSLPLQTISNRWRGVMLYSLACSSLKSCLEAAVKAHTDLGDANLRRADLRGANLQGASLGGADLDGADLRGANLFGANLRGANLRGAKLHGAALGGADLRGAKLRSADLVGADLGGADLDGALDTLQAACLSIVPESGAFEAWKQCRNGVLVHLRIPDDAARSNATGRKCRAAFVDVLAIEGATEAISAYDASVIYRVGERVTCHEWDPNRWKECSGGIHFFLTRAEAQAY